MTSDVGKIPHLSGEGMSTRAIGAAIGVSHPTVLTDLKSGGQDLPPEPEPEPGTVTTTTRTSTTQPTEERNPTMSTDPTADAISAAFTEANLNPKLAALTIEYTALDKYTNPDGTPNQEAIANLTERTTQRFPQHRGGGDAA